MFCPAKFIKKLRIFKYQRRNNDCQPGPSGGEIGSIVIVQGGTPVIQFDTHFCDFGKLTRAGQGFGLVILFQQLNLKRRPQLQLVPLPST